jgi:hypothetical protein
MKITTPNGILKVGLNTEIPITLTNPMFNEQGSHSLPFTVPWCKHNLKVLGNPERVSRANFVDIPVECSIQAKNLSLKGMLHIQELIESNSIELSFTFDNGSFWEWAKKTRLPQVAKANGSWNGVAFPFHNYFEKRYPEADMAFFPLAYAKDSDYIWDDIPKAPNDPDEDDIIKATGEIEQLTFAHSSFDQYNIVNHPIKILAVNNTQSLPFTGFIYTLEVLDWILGASNFRYDIFDFENIPDLYSMVVLNNAKDAFRGALIRYNELVPNITVAEFINSLEKDLSCVFFFNELNRTVSVKFWSSLLKNNEYKEVKGFLSVKNAENNKSSFLVTPKLTSGDYSSILQEVSEAELVSSSGFATTNDVKQQSTDYPIHTYELLNPRTQSLPKQSYPEFVIFSNPLQCYFHRIWEYSGSGTTWNYVQKAIHNKNYDYVTDKTIVEKTDRSSKTEFGTMVSVNSIQFYDTVNKNKFVNFYYLLPFINLEPKSKSVQIGSTRKYFYESFDKLAFAFYRGLLKHQFGQVYFLWMGSFWILYEAQVTIDGKTEWDIPFGSFDVFDPAGTKMDGSSVDYPGLEDSNVALRWHGENALSQFVVEYEAFLKDGFIKGSLSTKEINLPIDFSQLYRCNDQNFYIDKVNMVLTVRGIKISDIDVVFTKKIT